VFEQIEYELRGGGAWQLAEETLALGRGDCEDRATLLGSALASGVLPMHISVPGQALPASLPLAG